MALKDSTESKKSYKEKYDKKKGGTNSLFMCFRPVDLEPDQPVLTYIASVPKRERAVVLPRNDSEGLSFDEPEEGNDFAGKKISRSSSSRRLSRVWKAVFFEPSMARKTKKGKSDKKSMDSLTTESARYNFQEPSNRDDFDFGQRIISRSVSAIATSSSASTAASKSLICPTCSSLITETSPFGPNPNGSNKTSTTQRGYYCHYNYGCDVGLLLMLISLVVLVFWGKVCAIFCTSTFFFMPRWIVNDHRRRINSPLTSTNKLSESKRKIVMEGLLSRDRGTIR